MPKKSPFTINKKSTVDARRAMRYVKRLMAIPGPGGREGRVAEFIRRELSKAGAEQAWMATDRAHERTPIKGDTGNLVLTLPGNVRGPRRLLMAHMDTVPLCVGGKPRVHGHFIRPADKSTGLGADDRAGVAVLLHTAVELLRRKLPHPPLTFLWTIQEEGGLHGARLVDLRLLKKPKLAFNFDGGSSKKLTIGATGGYRMAITVRGKASHAGNCPEAGVSAIEVASRAITRLADDGWHGRIERDGKLGTSNFGVIHGGDATNVVANHVEVRAEARSHDSAFRECIVREMKRAFEKAANSAKSSDGESARIEFDGRLDYESFLLSKDEPCVVAAEAAVRAAGFQPQLAVANGGLDANLLTARGIPTVSLGCGQLNQHTTDEALEIPEFEDACRIAMFLATASHEQAS